MIKVLFAHLCEKAFLSQNGNLNLIGIFERVTSHQFPISFPQLSIVTSLEGETGQHQMVIKIVNATSGEELIKPITLNINIEAKQDAQQPAGPQHLRIIGDINNLNIKELGKYEVQIFLNNEKAYSVPFAAEKAQKPIPEGR
ncbi:MAG: hypothetical protein AB7J40_01505 [Candidatus Altimarinota bacterium]